MLFIIYYKKCKNYKKALIFFALLYIIIWSLLLINFRFIKSKANVEFYFDINWNGGSDGDW